MQVQVQVEQQKLPKGEHLHSLNATTTTGEARATSKCREACAWVLICSDLLTRHLRDSWHTSRQNRSIHLRHGADGVQILVPNHSHNSLKSNQTSARRHVPQCRNVWKWRGVFVGGCFIAAPKEKRHQIDVVRQGVLLHFSWRVPPTQLSRGSGFDYPPSQAATPSKHTQLVRFSDVASPQLPRS